MSESDMNREKVRAGDKREKLRLKDGGSVRNRMKEGYKKSGKICVKWNRLSHKSHHASVETHDLMAAVELSL